jgi:hypothetical protein
LKRLLILIFVITGTAFGQYSDTFSGTGGLGANYSFYADNGGSLTKSSGVVSVTGTGIASAVWTANSFVNFGINGQIATMVTPSGGAGNQALAVFQVSPGNGYVWPLNSHSVGISSNAFWSDLPAGDGKCPVPNAGDTVSLSVTQSGTITCTDVTTSVSGSFVDTTFTSGSPGFAAFQGSTVQGPVEFSCFPTACGTFPPPVPSSVPSGSSPPTTGPFYGILASISLTLPTSSVACYTTDGSTPTATTPGTCSHGTTYTSGNISLTQSSGGIPQTNTIKAIATSASSSLTSSVTTMIYVLEGILNTPNQSAMKWPLLAGSVVTMNSSIQFGTLNTVTANISGNYGGATGTLDSTASGNTVRTLTVGPTSGTCTVPQVYPVIVGNIVGGSVTSATITSGGSNLPASQTFAMELTDGTHTAQATFTTNSSGVAVSTAIQSSQTGFTGSTTDPTLTELPLLTQVVSTAGFNVNFVSDDDNTKIATFPITICQNTTDVEIFPFYDVLYSGQGIELTALTTGTTAPEPTWSITSQPAGGNGVLDANPQVACETAHSCYTTYFSATAPGRYIVQACNAIETSKCQQAILYVTGNSLPYAVTPNGTEPRDPTADPFGAANGGVVLDIGPSQTFHTILSAGDARTFTCGTTLRIHNEGVNGSPTTYPEWFSFYASGCQNNPIRMVGVPNASGELPVLEASNATGPTWINTAILSGVINSWVASCSAPGGAFWAAGPTGSCGPNWIVIEGLRIQDARNSFNIVLPGPVTQAWPLAGTAVNMHSGYGWVVRGNDMYNNALGVASYTVPSAGWGAVTQMLDVEGNRIQQYGNNGSVTEHGVYLQSNGEVVGSNNFFNPFTGMGGVSIKTRSYNWAVKYNFMGVGTSRYTDHVEVEDAGTFFGTDFYFCEDGNCAATLPVAVNTVVAYSNQYNNVTTPEPIQYLAGYIETSRNTWEVGNIYQGQTGQPIAMVHYAGDTPAGASPSTTMRGTIHFINNTIINNGWAFDTNAAGLGGNELYLWEWPRFDVQNNIIDSPNPQAVSAAQSFIGAFGNNLFRTGSVTVSPTPISFCHLTSGATCGWNDALFVSSIWNNVVPIDKHVTGLGNFLFTSTAPVNSTSFIPVSGSAAIGAGTTVTGLAQYFPARLQFNPVLGYTTLRAHMNTLGALDQQVINTSMVFGGKYYDSNVH